MPEGWWADGRVRDEPATQAGLHGRLFAPGLVGLVRFTPRRAGASRRGYRADAGT